MPKVALAVLAVAMALACWWLWSESTAATMDPIAGTAEDGAARGAADPADAGGAATVDPAAAPSGASPADADRVSAVPKDHTWVVRGRVVKAHKTPLAGARFTMRCFAGTDTNGALLRELPFTADAEGRFEWPLPVPASTVTLFGQGAMAKHTRYATTVVVPKGHEPPQQFEIWVSPLDRVVTGTVLDEQKQPIESSWVGIVRDKHPVGPDGTFRLDQASGYGRNVIEAGAPGYTTQRQMLVFASEAETAVHFTLQPGFRIAGRVVDERGEPVAGASVATFYTMWEPVLSADDGAFAITTADAARNAHSLFARKEGWVEARTEVDGKNPLPAYDLVLRRGARVHGRVFDPQGAPVAGASLYIGFSPNAYNRLDAVSGDDGTFEFPAVEGGKQTMVTSSKGLAPDTRVLDVPKGQNELSVDVHLQPAHFLAGVVVDRGGRGLPGITINVRVKKPEGAEHRDERGEYIDARTATGPDGGFRLDGLPGGVVNLEVHSASTVRHIEKDVAVDRSDVRLVVVQSAQLAGKVVDDATGEPVRDFRVFFVEPQLRDGEVRIGGYSASWVREGHSFQSDDGVFRTKNEQLEPGAVTGIEVSAKGYAPARNPHVVAAVDADPEACIVRLQRGGRIVGKVTSGADGQPVAGARIAHADPGRPIPENDDEFGGRLRATTAGDGTFVLQDVPPGEASLRILAPGLPPHTDGPFQVPAAGEVERRVQVPDGASITGVLLDTEQTPMPDTLVQLVGDGKGGGAGEMKTDAAGRFRSTTPIAPGEYAIRAQPVRNGVFFAVWQRVTLVAGQTLEVEVRPAGRGVLRGTMVGDVVEGVFNLHAWPMPPRSNAQPFYVAACSNGKFELRGLPVGDYRVMVYHVQGRASGTATCKVSEAEPTVIEVTVKANSSGGR